ncbi:MAG TPA: isoprenylcysteine carboxylmethyltransferase family protein [Thermodesulfovibrionales bacterium]|nr:isoprenylcysteine carboxylmethyltransferase family protein [Thermodesulfovibrionales bacterium]
MLAFKLVVNSIISLVIMGGLLFLPAGTFDWWRAWVLIGTFLAGSVISVVSLFPEHKDLLRERLRPPMQKGQPLADKIIMLFFLLFFYGMFAFIPLDVFRFHLMGRPGPPVSSLGMVLFIAGWRIIYLALRENAFAALVVKLQKERGQVVIDSGVYGVVRHPMYAGAIPFILGIPLWLNSYAAAVLALIPVLLLLLRIPKEEAYLGRELRGYEAYTKKVRYRIIPHIW